MKKIIAWLKKIPLQNIILIVIVGFSIIFVARILITSVISHWKMQEYVQTEGTVIDCRKFTTTAISSSRSSGSVGRQTRYTITVQYSVDGVRYTLQDSEIATKVTRGTQMTVYYNPKNPADGLIKEQVSYAENRLFAVLLPLFGIISVVGLLILVEVICKKWRKFRKRKKF